MRSLEAICLNQGLDKGNLEAKIDKLVEKNLLARPQADLLNLERWMGNAAVQEMETPAARDIEDGLNIIGGLINTIYVLSKHDARLQKQKADGEAKRASAKEKPSGPAAVKSS